MIKFCSKYVFQYKIEYGIYFLLGIILCGLNTFIPAAMGQFINMFNVETTYSAMLKFIFLLLLLYVGKEIVCYVNKILYISQKVLKLNFLEKFVKNKKGLNKANKLKFDKKLFE